ncbi:proline rich transmembrane protein 1B isoform X1 [Electrophorus electricus]|uniref:proline rich transmembrane protein 1B isoform X1 n=1 Tax=Electrophorus electricus TaxID=8005 RepID=UPI0015D0AEB1|nr:proline rich transmembrane protein 1B isoform X1 [Electrophorus electricus]
MDAASPPNFSVDAEVVPTATSPRAPEPQRPPGCRTPPARASFHTHDSISILTAGSAMDTDSIHADRPATDDDGDQTAPRPFDTDSAQTAQLTCDTESNRTLNPAYDADSTRALHSTCDLEQTAPEGGDGALAGGHAESLSEDPPPYSLPDPKFAYLIYPPPLPHYANQPVVACQPAAGPPAFNQPSFMPTSYAIYMNGPPIAEDRPPLPKDYLVESLLVTIFCCLMSGLVALMYSFETRTALARGDIREGVRASQKARLLIMHSLSGCGYCREDRVRKIQSREFFNKLQIEPLDELSYSL